MQQPTSDVSNDDRLPLLMSESEVPLLLRYHFSATGGSASLLGLEEAMTVLLLDVEGGEAGVEAATGFDGVVLGLLPGTTGGDNAEDELLKLVAGFTALDGFEAGSGMSFRARDGR